VLRSHYADEGHDRSLTFYRRVAGLFTNRHTDPQQDMWRLGILREMGICEVLSSPRVPWQSADVERVMGSVRQECLDHVIVFYESSLRRTLQSYFACYHRSRTHLSLGKDAPEPRAIQPPELGAVVAIPQVGGLHHRYERRAA